MNIFSEPLICNTQSAGCTPTKTHLCADITQTQHSVAGEKQEVAIKKE